MKNKTVRGELSTLHVVARSEESLIYLAMGESARMLEKLAEALDNQGELADAVKVRNAARRLRNMRDGWNYPGGVTP